ncbi:hypothetical protein [Micromonospora yangpuensis]|uniref:Uncharacterized protein n=1 Tax=Micromonospora yangpuensis TaxID=683228 RepID=A0A1C6VBW7_9ACTN|nr:hypothetical protein [Micromonospora yangpuensis]GGM12540.1 hypothetical protein GCM10012279_33320 [Micromonospora yangpuensis]SCL63755.1 hypothetical protein GA0070617_5291 [Micromonospora yangpuensis]
MPEIPPTEIAYVQHLLDGRRAQLRQDLTALPAALAKLSPDERNLNRYEELLERYRFVDEMRNRKFADRPAYDSPESLRFDAYQRNLRAEVDNPLRQFLQSARDHARQNPHLVTPPEQELLGRAAGVFAQVHAMENDLRDARLKFGRAAATAAREGFVPVNQVDEFVRSAGTSTMNAERVLDPEDAIQDSDLDTMRGQVANLARAVGGGKCGNYSAEIVTLVQSQLYDSRRNIGDQITVIDFLAARGQNGKDVGFDHVAPVIGPPFHPESVVVDAWTKEPTVTSVLNYSVAQMRAFDRESFDRADGRDYKAIAARDHSPEAWLRENPPQRVSLDPTAASRFRETMASHPHADSVYDIQHGYYNRMANPAAGRALTLENFELTAANGFARSRSQSPAPALSEVLQQTSSFLQNRSSQGAPASSSAAPPAPAQQNRGTSPRR